MILIFVFVNRNTSFIKNRGVCSFALECTAGLHPNESKAMKTLRTSTSFVRFMAAIQDRQLLQSLGDLFSDATSNFSQRQRNSNRGLRVWQWRPRGEKPLAHTNGFFSGIGKGRNKTILNSHRVAPKSRGTDRKSSDAETNSANLNFLFQTMLLLLRKTRQAIEFRKHFQQVAEGRSVFWFPGPALLDYARDFRVDSARQWKTLSCISNCSYHL